MSDPRIDLDADGVAALETIPTPVPRALREVRGLIDDLLADRPDDPELAQAWLKVIITDASRPASPMERLRAKWPYTLVLEFVPEGARISSDDDLARLRRTTDPVQIATMFVEYVDNAPATDEEVALLTAAVEQVRDREVATG